MYFKNCQEEIKEENQIKARKLFKLRGNQSRKSSQSTEANFSKNDANLGVWKIISLKSF